MGSWGIHIRCTRVSIKFQIPNIKNQTNNNDQNSKFQTFGNWDLRFICNLVLVF